jgi:2-oxo-4-hydroxy-4-carboxy-5-ureidoimidazoline decarboxylase
MPTDVTLDDLNACDRAHFADAVNGAFEHAPWVALRAWEHRPFDSLAQLQRAVIAEIVAASPDEQLALIRVHPELGRRRALSRASSREQRGAGLDALSADEHHRLARLNAEYRSAFTFPFVLAVRGCTTQDVFATMERRLHAAPADEAHEALRQVCRIASFRLEQLLA